MTTPTDPEGDDLVPLSALNALLYCDRRAALRHLDGLYVHNEHTLRGDSLHKRADKPGFEKRKGVRTERGLWIASRRLRLFGRADLVEFRREPGKRRRGEAVVEVASPVEYKRGKKRRWDNDDVQLCARPSASRRCSERSSRAGPSTTSRASRGASSSSRPNSAPRPKPPSTGSTSCSGTDEFPRPFSSHSAEGARSAAIACPKPSATPVTLANYLGQLFHAD